MLLVIRMDVRVKWPSERSEWLLDAAAALTQSKGTATPSGGSADNHLFSGKRSNGSLVVRDCQETAKRLLTIPPGIKSCLNPPAFKKHGGNMYIPVLVVRSAAPPILLELDEGS